ncbi:MAG: xylulokinase [Rhizobiaceae bacterium]|nr:xylulokinase [Rhizobiaceae bacterium]
MGLFLGLDLGAGSLKASLVGRDGALVASGSAPVPTASPFVGASEQDPQDWWRALCDAVRQVLDAGGVDARRIEAIAISAGAHSSVLADETGRPLRPAIMWNDQRSRAQVNRLRAEAGDRIGPISTNTITPTWTLPHLVWLNENEPQTISATQRLYPAKDWLRFRLTGDYATEPIDAVGLMLYDPARRGWSEELVGLTGLSMNALPPVIGSLDVAGRVTPEAAVHTGLAVGTPVIAGVSDTAAEALGAGMFRADTGVVKLATAATLSCIASGPEPTRKLVSYPYLPEPNWFWIAGTNSCASAHAWLRRTLFSQAGGEPLGYGEMDKLASAVAPGSNGLYFHPYLNGERAPYYDPDLRADFVGMTFHHGPGHFVRAFYEGIAYSLADCRRQFDEAGVNMPVLRLTGGGSRSALWRQILADVLNARIELPEVADASFGCALVAGLGVGAFSPVAGLGDLLKVSSVTEPNPQAVERYRHGFAVYREIQAALAPINRRISAAERDFAAMPGTSA